jgi:hypothetical protein
MPSGASLQTDTKEEAVKERPARFEQGGVMSTMRELAHRSAHGVEVTLVWVRDEGADETVVFVSDHREGSYFEIPTEPYLALDVYYHPFAYRDFSTVDYEDSRLAA